MDQLFLNNLSKSHLMAGLHVRYEHTRWQTLSSSYTNLHLWPQIIHTDLLCGEIPVVGNTDHRSYSGQGITWSVH